jgi:hypothetical protein
MQEVLLVQMRLGGAPGTALWLAVSIVAGVASGCRGNNADVGTHDSGEAELVAASPKARATLSSLRGRAGSPLPNGVADGFRAVVGGLKPQFGAGADKLSARVLLPLRATEPLHIEDATTDTSVDVQMAGIRDAAAEVADGYVVYRNAHESEATVLHRAGPDGVEDFISFETRPSVSEIEYDLALGLGVSGLRLVAGTLEILDASGAPRLRVSTPYIVGADGVRTDALLAVEGCAVDKDPAPRRDAQFTCDGMTRWLSIRRFSIRDGRRRARWRRYGKSTSC